MTADAVTLQDRLLEFRSTYSAVEFDHGGHSWRYWRAGASTDAVLWLTGALGLGEFAFAHVLGVEADFRVLVPDYPPVSKLHHLADGLASLLDTEGIAAAHVVGVSFGGMVAQHLVRRHPSRVRSLVLSHTAPPDPSRLRVALIEAVSLLLPERLYRTLVSRRLRRSFGAADPFWVQYFDETLARLKKADLVSRARLIGEFLQSDFGPKDLEGWPGRVLIMGGDDDPQMPRGAKEALRRRYPTAGTHTFSGMGHSAAILEPEQYVTVIREFLASGDS